MTEKNNPVQRPGDGARAIDTIHTHSIRESDFPQAFISAKTFIEWEYGTIPVPGEEYYEVYCSLISYLSGYASNMPLGVATNGVRKILHERYQIKDDE